MKDTVRRRLHRSVTAPIDETEIERLRRLVEPTGVDGHGVREAWGAANARAAMFVAEAAVMCDDFDAYVAMSRAELKAVQKVSGKGSKVYAWCMAARMCKVMLKIKG